MQCSRLPGCRRTVYHDRQILPVHVPNPVELPDVKLGFHLRRKQPSPYPASGLSTAHMAPRDVISISNKALNCDVYRSPNGENSGFPCGLKNESFIAETGASR